MLPEASSSSPDQGFTPLRARANNTSCMPSEASTGSRSSVKRQQQVHRGATRRLLCLHQTRPRAISALGSNVAVPAPSLSSSRRVIPCSLAARVDELVQNLDERHVRCNSSTSPPRHAHTTLCRRFVDRLFLLRRSFKGATNNRGHAPRRGHMNE